MAIVKFLKKFTKRYFVLDLNSYIFGYQEKESSSKLQSFGLELLRKVERFPRVTTVCNYKFAFYVEIDNREFFLYADSLSVHNQWCNGLLACFPTVENSKITLDQTVIPQTPSVVEEQVLQKPDLELPQVKHEPDFIIQEEKPQPDSDFSQKTPKPAVLPRPPKTPEPPKEKPPISNPRAHFLVVKNKEEIPEPEKIEKNFEIVGQDLDDDVKIIAGPKCVKKDEDSFAGVVPVIVNRVKTNFSSDFRKVDKKIAEVEKNDGIVNQARTSSALKDYINQKNSNIQGMLDDLDDIGLDKVQIRTGSEIRKNISEKSNKNENFKVNHREEKNTENRRFDVFEKNDTIKKNLFERREEINDKGRNDKLGNSGRNKSESKRVKQFDDMGIFRPEKDHNDKGLKTLSYRPVSTKLSVKPKYEEKPNTNPDEPIIAKQPQPTKKASSKTPILTSAYTEKLQQLKPQGKDCDWDNWDD
jgi:hypothetical protein